MESKVQDEWLFLKNTVSNYELEIITSMLDQFQIPVLKKASDSWNIPSFIMGEIMASYDLYVPSSRIAEAREILENMQPVEQDVPWEDALPGQDQEPGHILSHRPGLNKLLLILVVASVVLGLLLAVFQNMLD